LLTEARVVTSCSFYPTAFPWVGDDVALAAERSVRHLLENGHNRIAMICGNWIDGEAFASFARGFSVAMAEFGVTPDRSLLVHNYPGETLESLAENILSRNPAPTAVFCENWRVCQAVLKAATKLRLKLPDDLSIVGYGQNICEIHEPLGVTAFVPETAKVGEMAAELLYGLIEGKQNLTQPVMVPGRLIERESVRRIVGARNQE
jgi:LacI family transcriptional regulator